MAIGTRETQIGLIAGFLALLFAVPISQIGIGLWLGERVQATDLFRYAPTQANLRRFERTLEDRSWFQQAVRPRVQWAFFEILGDAGAKGLVGRHGWLFYRPGVQYLVEPDLPEPPESRGAYVLPATGATRRRSVAEAIVRYRDQLRERGIQLLVVPAPEKPSIYPDRLTRRAEGRAGEFRSPTEALLAELAQRGVDTVDLFSLFREARRTAPNGEALYLARDTHWTPLGARLAADAVARRIRDLGWAPTHRRDYATQRVRVQRSGDILEMLQVPGIQSRYPAEVVECEQVLDRATGPLVPRAGAREGTYMNSHLVDTPLHPAILVLGDSFCRIYQLPEPQSLGRLPDAFSSPRSRVGTQGLGRSGVPPREPGEEDAGAPKTGHPPAGAGGREDAGAPKTGHPPAGAGGRDAEEVDREGRRSTKRLLPGSAGFPSLLALALSAPVDYIASDGGAATDVRQRLSVNAEILERKRVVVWEFAERDIALGREGWRDVPLPPALE
jgi:hypothetical protein